MHSLSDLQFVVFITAGLTVVTEISFISINRPLITLVCFTNNNTGISVGINYWY